MAAWLGVLQSVGVISGNLAVSGEQTCIVIKWLLNADGNWKI